MPAYKETYEDFNLKWAHTYALYKDDQIVYVTGAEPLSEDSDDFNITLSPLNGKKIYSNDPNCLTPLIFNSQYFNGVDFNTNNPLQSRVISCMLLSRNPRRQNKRSFCSDNITITSPLFPILQHYNVGIQFPEYYKLDLSFVQRIKDCKFPNYLDALQICSKQLSIAISPQFAISLSHISSDKFLLSSPFGFIGEATTTEFLIYHLGALQEVHDFVRRENIPVVVRETIF